jgi:hypothetical protein
MGVFILILTILAFTAGSIRNEGALILVGAVFQAALCYCFFTIFVLSCIHRKPVQSVTSRIVTKQADPGTQVEYIFITKKDKEKFFRMPGILIRYELRLYTKDGRYVQHLFDPDCARTGTFPAPERGAYYTRYDEFTLFDASGFFRLAFRIPHDAGPRLLVLPQRIDKPIPANIRSGGRVQRQEPRLLRTDTLTDHRPYIPGDDPRRINWKLYGHLGDLFVREGEPEPPPHSRLLIVVDSQADSALYAAEDARRGTDRLCENALALALLYAERGIDVAVGYIGGGICRGTPLELAGALAHPAALPLSAQEDLPCSSDDEGLLILALPRLPAKTSALDRLFEKTLQETDVAFLYDDERLAGPATACAERYARKTGIHAQSVRLL